LKNIQIPNKENPSSGSRVVPRGLTDKQTDGQVDRHDEGNSRFFFAILRKFLERPQAYENYFVSMKQ